MIKFDILEKEIINEDCWELPHKVRTRYTIEVTSESEVLQSFSTDCPDKEILGVVKREAMDFARSYAKKHPEEEITLYASKRKRDDKR